MDISPDIITLAGVLLATGCLAGFSAGLFGIGGGAVMVPALYYVFSALGYPESTVMHTAVATSSAVIIISSIRSVMSHHSHKAVDWAVLWPSQKIKSWGLWIGLGALLASAVLAKYISGRPLVSGCLFPFPRHSALFSADGALRSARPYHWAMSIF